jgi:hypothetical protein
MGCGRGEFGGKVACVKAEALPPQSKAEAATRHGGRATCGTKNPRAQSGVTMPREAIRELRGQFGKRELPGFGGYGKVERVVATVEWACSSGG